MSFVRNLAICVVTFLSAGLIFAALLWISVRLSRRMFGPDARWSRLDVARIVRLQSLPSDMRSRDLIAVVISGGLATLAIIVLTGPAGWFVPIIWNAAVYSMAATASIVAEYRGSALAW
ncbi:hypothetical protein [Nocardia jejuensis]|uniref:hypothetical protein n=1 Tax=Nocardia jejuensis TaxID=328049 RepID=UPI000832B469|nr:hypothetical protein [Nocardia jejuensis]